jgi:predicted ATP-binding protein involved in virulence
MRCRKIAVHNFASIKDLEVVCEAKVILLGPNNHGRPNLLNAIDFFLSLPVKVDLDTFFEHRDAIKNKIIVLWVTTISAIPILLLAILDYMIGPW